MRIFPYVRSRAHFKTTSEPTTIIIHLAWTPLQLKPNPSKSIKTSLCLPSLCCSPYPKNRYLPPLWPPNETTPKPKPEILNLKPKILRALVCMQDALSRGNTEGSYSLCSQQRPSSVMRFPVAGEVGTHSHRLTQLIQSQDRGVRAWGAWTALE